MNDRACPDCNGIGSRSGIAGHCFDIDGGFWHYPGECTAPEHPGSNCCPPCSTCGGSGRVPVQPPGAAMQEATGPGRHDATPAGLSAAPEVR